MRVKILRRGGRVRHSPGQERGTTIVELSFVIMAFFVLLLGILDIGRGVWAHNSIAAAARDATRHAIVHGERANNPASADDIHDYIVDQLPGALSNGISVNTTWDPDNSRGSRVTVTVQYNFQPVSVLFPSIPLTATSEMSISY